MTFFKKINPYHKKNTFLGYAIFVLLLLANISICWGQTLNMHSMDDSTLFNILSNKDPLVDEIINHPEKYNFQLIFSRINNKISGTTIETFSINEGRQYFYPASLIKFPLAFVALEKMTSLKDSGITLNSRIKLHTCSCDEATNSYVAKHKNPTMLQFLKEMMVMSNNDAYNLYFDFIGRDLFNSRMKQMNILNIQMKNRFTRGCGEEQNKISGGIQFLRKDSMRPLNLPCITSNQEWTIDSVNFPTIFENKIYYNKKTATEHKNNAAFNYVSLLQAHQLMIYLFFPNLNLYKDSFHIDPNYKSEFKNALGLFPRELEHSSYDTAHLPDNYYKFFVDNKIINTKMPGFKIYNKVGLSTGFVSDISYFVDSVNNVEYVISAAILSKTKNTNENNYNEFGIPILQKIGSYIYLNEVKNKRKKP